MNLMITEGLLRSDRRPGTKGYLTRPYCSWSSGLASLKSPSAAVEGSGLMAARVSAARSRGDVGLRRAGAQSLRRDPGRPQLRARRSPLHAIGQDILTVLRVVERLEARGYHPLPQSAPQGRRGGIGSFTSEAIASSDRKARQSVAMRASDTDLFATRGEVRAFAPQHPSIEAAVEMRAAASSCKRHCIRGVRTTNSWQTSPI